MTLHDGAIAYDFDDVQTSEHKRQSDEVVVMQIHTDDGLWHRTLPDHTATACGLKFNLLKNAPRPEELTGPLCEICFTDHERGIEPARQAERDSDEGLRRRRLTKNGEEK